MRLNGHVAIATGAGRGITANVVTPGVIATEGVCILPQGERMLDAIVATRPVKRNGRPQDVASAAAYLASPDAGFVTGPIIDVNGGSVFY